MEHHIQSAEENLIEGLKFKLPSTASYVIDRRQVQFSQQGSNIYTPTGTRLIKFHLASDEWLDPSTLKFNFKLQNTGATGTDLWMIGGPWTFFKRLRRSSC